MKSLTAIAALLVILVSGCAQREGEVAGDAAERTAAGTAATTGTPMGETVTTTDAVVDPDVAKLAIEEPIKVAITDTAIRVTGSPMPGATQFQVTNEGTRPHTLAIEGGSVKAQLERPLQPQEVSSLTVDVAPGTYRLYCPEEADTLTTQLTVEAPAQ